MERNALICRPFPVVHRFPRVPFRGHRSSVEIHSSAAACIHMYRHARSLTLAFCTPRPYNNGEPSHAYTNRHLSCRLQPERSIRDIAFTIVAKTDGMAPSSTSSQAYCIENVTRIGCSVRIFCRLLYKLLERERFKQGSTRNLQASSSGGWSSVVAIPTNYIRFDRSLRQNLVHAFVVAI